MSSEHGSAGKRKQNKSVMINSDPWSPAETTHPSASLIYRNQSINKMKNPHK